jgi:ABC-type multidrug transport system fused ATPase/permease subunit
VVLTGATANTRRKVGTFLVSEVTDALYQKQFRLAPSERSKRPDGKIINLINTDSQRLARALTIFEDLWTIPLNLTIAVVLLYSKLGSSIIVCVILVIVNLLITSGTGKYLHEMFEDISIYSDKRVDMIRDALTGIRIVKFMSMENYFFNEINEIREKLLWATKRVILRLVVPQGFSELLPGLMPVSAFSMYSVDNTLDPAVVFPALILFIRIYAPLNNASITMIAIAGFTVAYKRTNEFLLAKELGVDGLNQYESFDDNSLSIDIKGATWAYDSSESESFEVSIENLEIAKGSLVGIIGSVGSVKSSFLNAIAGEMEKTQGSAVINGTIAYCPQTPWIITGSIQQNIVFYSKLNSCALSNATSRCALDEDLKRMSDGVLTEIGENGINLSGGQKARLSLARALYKNSDVYLFDDPTSALDSKVEKAVFENAI